MTVTQRVAQQFGNAAESYEQHATMQRETAKRLIASLEPWRDIIPPGPILEIGCGTGFVTRGLLELYPERALEITDISQGMVDFCSRKFGSRGNASFYQLDAQNLPFQEQRYALAIGGFVAQWFDDPALTLGRCLEALLPGGLLLASFPGNESFPQWKSHCEELGLPYTGNTLPDTEEMVIKLSQGPAQVDFYEDTVTQTFESAAAFFQQLKRVGASTQKSGRPLAPREMKLLVDHWDSAAGDEIEVSWHLVFVAVKRD